MIPVEPFIRQHGEGVRPPPLRTRPSLRTTFFGDIASAVLTVTLLVVALMAVSSLLSWAVINGVWEDEGGACREAGACWAFLRQKLPFILLGLYPEAERWRPALAIMIFVLLTLWSMPPRRWTMRTMALWVIGTLTALVLMGGGILGLAPVPTSDWGGLPITLLLTVLSLAIGFPFAIALALGRRSELPVIRWICIGFVELIRALPLLSLLFIAAILLPIMLPDGVTIDNLLRALIALTFYSAAYLAEVLRGGLQGIPRGQEEASRALGLSWVATTRLVILPQAIRKVIPPLTNTAVVIVKNTSLVLVVGLFDLLSAGRAALADPDWPAPYVETYLLVAFVYFVICFGISRYTLWLERNLVEEARS